MLCRLLFYLLLWTPSVCWATEAYMPWNFPGGVPAYPTQTAATFEQSPAGTDLGSTLDDRIQELKYNIRLRENAEQCWDTSTTGFCTAGSGRGRQGSARIFYVNLAPAALSVSDALGSNALDSGRLWVSKIGLDGINATIDDYQLKVYDGALWKAVVAMGTSAVNHSMWMWSTTPGVTSWVQTVPFSTLIDSASNATGAAGTGADPDVAHAGAPADITLAGGSGAGGNPAVVVPAAGTHEDGTYYIHVSGGLDFFNAGPSATFVGLYEDDNGGGFTLVRPCKGVTNGIGQRCSFDYYKDLPTVGHTYTYKLEAQSSAAGTTINPTAGGYTTAGFPADATYLQVVLRSKLGIETKN